MPYMAPYKPSLGERFQAEIPGLTKDLLLMALTQGASLPFQGVGRVATAGQYQAPNGNSTFIGPAERVASNPKMSAGQVVSQNRPVGSSFVPTQHGFGQVPDLDRQLKESTIGYQNAYQGYLQGNTPQQTPQVDPLQQLEDAALAGDEEAVTALRILRKYQGAR